MDYPSSSWICIVPNNVATSHIHHRLDTGDCPTASIFPTPFQNASLWQACHTSRSLQSEASHAMHCEHRTKSLHFLMDSIHDCIAWFLGSPTIEKIEIVTNQSAPYSTLRFIQQGQFNEYIDGCFRKRKIKHAKPVAIVVVV